ncbi:MAG: alpha/beta hydrolase [Pseudomonadota bacterium]
MVAASVIAFLIVLAVAATWASAAYRADRAEAATPAAGTFIDVMGVRIHAEVMGEGPDVVLLHGAFGSTRDFTFDLAGRLAENYRVIAFDRPGMGYSEHTNPNHARAFAKSVESPLEQARVLAAAARELGADRPIVVGHSFGGIVAIAWALDHDPAALVLLAGVAMPWPGTLSPIYRSNGTALGGGLIAPLISAWVPGGRLKSGVENSFSPQTMPKGYAEHIGPYMPLRLSAFRATTRQVNTLRPYVVRMQTRYARLALPIEILHGSEDKTVPMDVHSRPFSRLVKTAKLRVLDGVGHMPHHADPEAAIAAINRAAARADLR